MLLYVFILNNSDVHDFTFTVVLNIIVNALSSVFVTTPVTCLAVNGGVPRRAGTWRNFFWRVGGGEEVLVRRRPPLFVVIS